MSSDQTRSPFGQNASSRDVATDLARHLANVNEDSLLANNSHGIKESDENAVAAVAPELGTEIPVSASSSARDFTQGSADRSSHVGQFASDIAPVDASEATIGADPEISGFDLVADAKPTGDLRTRLESRTQDLKQHATHLRERAADFLQELPAKREALIERGSEFAKTAEQTARRNPWLSVAVASAGALAVGFLLGRAIFGGQPTPPRRDEEDAPIGYDE